MTSSIDFRVEAGKSTPIGLIVPDNDGLAEVTIRPVVEHRYRRKSRRSTSIRSAASGAGSAPIARSRRISEQRKIFFTYFFV